MVVSFQNSPFFTVTEPCPVSESMAMIVPTSPVSSFWRDVVQTSLLPFDGPAVLYRPGTTSTPTSYNPSVTSVNGPAGLAGALGVTIVGAPTPDPTVADDPAGVCDPPRAIADTFDRLYRDREATRRMGKAGNALVRDVVPRWPDVVSRLLD